MYFTHASAPASQTAVSLATLFSGRAFSEQRWETFGAGKSRFPYPAADPSPRFPRLLSEHGIGTSNDAGLVFFHREYGVVTGFTDEKVTGIPNVGAPPGRQLVSSLLERLAHRRQRPLFLYTHILEPHEPYGQIPKGGTAHERYLGAVGVADGLVASVMSFLEAHYRDRWALFVSADHGEAFGEHQTREHSKTLYEEVLHVPLFARSPFFEPRVIDERVGLVDLGPTLLDLFRVDTPPTFDGRSHVPILAGGTATLDRPLLAESRLRRALTLPDGLKVIEDPRRKVVEVYDLTADPGETRNLFDADPARADPALATLRAYFAVHAVKGGYEPPYKP